MSSRMTLAPSPPPASSSISPIGRDKSVLSTFLSVAYVVGFSPCKLRLLKDGSVQLQSNSFHKIFFACLILSTNFVRFAEVRKRLPQSNEDWNPLKYFQFLSGSINVIFNLTVALALSRNARKMVNMANFLNKASNLPRPEFAETLKLAVRWLCIADILLGVGMALADTDLISSPTSSPSRNFTASIWCMKQEAKFTVFLDSLLECRNGSFPQIYQGEPILVEASDYVVASILSFLKVFRQIFGYFGELLLLIGVIELWLPSFAFHKMAKSDLCKENDLTCSVIPFAAKFEILQEHYNNLKRCSKLINDVFSRMILWFIIASIFYYSCNLDVLFVTNSQLERIRVITFYVSALATYLLAADICHKVKAFDEWISELPSEEIGIIGQNSLTIILHELDSNKVGIKGNNIFTVTYAFLANMMGVLMTYFIVCVQARPPWLYSEGVM